MPAAVFTAVPRTPPPPCQLSHKSLELTSTLLNSSMLTRLFATPKLSSDSPRVALPAATAPFSDTDTSLFDYDQDDDLEPG